MARELAKEHLARGDALGWFESLYSRAQGNSSIIPWADLRPNHNLVKWLDEAQGNLVARGGKTLVVGCGLGDDAEELARRGFEVTAFDISPTAVGWCKQRFRNSNVEYKTADLLETPEEWRGAFKFALESYTLQVLPADFRAKAMKALAGVLATSGTLLVICRGRQMHESKGEMPWPLTKEELGDLSKGARLEEKAFNEYWDEEEPSVRRFTVAYQLRR